MNPDSHSSDAQLAVDARGGAADALGELYARHAAAIMALAYRLTGSATDAEDVLHDLFLGLPEALRRYDERGRFDAWIRRVAARLALMRLRSRRRRREVGLEATAALSGPPGDEATRARVAIRRALDALPASLRAVYVLKEIEGYSHAEIAALLGITSGASEVRLSRAVRRLRQLLGGSP